jgi:hypothetical protein
MEALKFLRPGRVAPFANVVWPEPGEWLESDEPPELCLAGVHALLPAALAPWIAEELWRVELEGGKELAPGIVVGQRARLLSRVVEWNEETAREFARACAEHVRAAAPRGQAAEYAADAAAAAEGAVANYTAATVGYMAAHAAEAMRPGGFTTERRWQSLWLATRLGILAA